MTQYLFKGHIPSNVDVYPIETTVYVPSTKKNGTVKVTSNELKRRVTSVRRYMSKYGGYTSVKAVGGYVMREGEHKGQVVKEPVVKVTAYASENQFKRTRKGLVGQVQRWSNKWGQESVAVEHETDLYFIKGKAPIKKEIKRHTVLPARRINPFFTNMRY